MGRIIGRPPPFRFRSRWIAHPRDVQVGSSSRVSAKRLPLICAWLFVLAAGTVPAAAANKPNAGAEASAVQKAGAPSPNSGRAPGRQGHIKPTLERWCETPGVSPYSLSGRSRLVAVLANGIIWQPQDGRVQFTIQAADGAVPSSLNDIELRVCFGWPNKVAKSGDTKKSPTHYHSSYLETLSRTDTSVTYATTLPEGLWADQNAPTYWDTWKDFWRRVTGDQRHVYDGLGLVPTLDMHIVGDTIPGTIAAKNIGAANDPNGLDTILPVGISFRWVALLITVIFVLLAWWALWHWARNRNVRGGRFLSIIANRNNYASLSQFQILLWTFVIGAGAVYVMSLSGSLISIPAQALALLGISGFSALTAAIKSKNDASKQETTNDGVSSSTATSTSADSLNTVAAPREAACISVGAAEAFLFWRPPEGGLPASQYSVGLRSAPDGVPAPVLPSAPFVDPFVNISKLQPGKSYSFDVRALDGNGNKSQQATITVVTNDQLPGDGPRVEDLAVSLPNADNAPRLTWTAANKKNPADAYVVQFRRAGTRPWSAQAVFPSRKLMTSTRSAVIGGLDFSTPYEFQVFGVKNGQAGTTSGVVSVMSGKRMPQWSDLVVWDGIGELDITRVQMLAFTLLAAVFVGIKIIDESAIPAVPDSIVLLMGLSNGVYVGGKFIGNP